MLKCFLKMGNKKLKKQKKLKIKTVSNMYNTHTHTLTQSHTPSHTQGQQEATKMFIAHSKNTHTKRDKVGKRQNWGKPKMKIL